MTKHDHRIRSAARTALGSLALLAQFCRADDYSSPTDERVRLSLGAMYVFNATTIRADSSAGLEGTEIGGESLFGLSNGNIEPKFAATVCPISESVARTPRFTPCRTRGPLASSGTYSRL